MLSVASIIIALTFPVRVSTFFDVQVAASDVSNYPEIPSSCRRRTRAFCGPLVCGSSHGTCNRYLIRRFADCPVWSTPSSPAVWSSTSMNPGIPMQDTNDNPSRILTHTTHIPSNTNRVPSSSCIFWSLTHLFCTVIHCKTISRFFHFTSLQILLHQRRLTQNFTARWQRSRCPDFWRLLR